MEKLLPEVELPQVQVHNIRVAMAYIAAAFYGNPASSLRMFAVTGTKGKTTTTYLAKAVLEKTGLKCGLIGTIGNMIGDEVLKSTLTTPDPLDLHQVLREMVDRGVQAVVMEASAHALDMHRLDGIVFEGVAFTNLSQDHLDYFHTMENYAAAKKKLFSPYYTKNCAFNADDVMTPYMMEGVTLPLVTFGISADCDIYAREIEIGETGVSFRMRLRGGLETRVDLKMTGMFNVYNAMTAAALGMIAGATMEQIRDGLQSVRSVPGRAEMLDTDTPYKVILDYSMRRRRWRIFWAWCASLQRTASLRSLAAVATETTRSGPLWARLADEWRISVSSRATMPAAKIPMQSWKWWRKASAPRVGRTASLKTGAKPSVRRLPWHCRAM